MFFNCECECDEICAAEMSKMTDFVAIRCVFSSSKYTKNSFSAGAPPRTPLGKLTTLPQTP